MKVTYTVDFAIEVEATAKNMALHEAGTRWPVLEEHLQNAANDVTIRSIRVDSAKKAAETED